MSNIAFLLSFCSIFTPGILWNHIVITYSGKRKPSDTIFMIWSFIFGFLVYGIEWLLFIISSYIFKLLSTSIVLLCLLLLIVLSVILSYFLHLEKLYKLNKSRHILVRIILTLRCIPKLRSILTVKRIEQYFKWFSIIILIIAELLLLHYVHHYYKKLTNISFMSLPDFHNVHHYYKKLTNISLPDFHNLDFVNLYVVSIIILSLPVAFLLSCFHLWLNKKEILLNFLRVLSLTQKSATKKDTWEVVLDDRTRSFDKDQKNKAEVWDFEKGIIVTGILQNASETGEPKALFLTDVTVESFYCEGNRVERKEIERDKNAMYMDIEKALVFLSRLGKETEKNKSDR